MSDAKGFTSNAHDLTFPDGYVDPLSGYEIPKNDPKEMRKWRSAMRSMLYRHGPHRPVIWEACRSSFEFFTDAFVWTPKSIEIGPDGKARGNQGESVYQPYVTWPVHLGLHKKFRQCIRDGEDLAVPKSRDMRATWHFLIEAVWDLLFNQNATVLMLSRKEDLVDGPDPDALLPRVRDILKRLPSYLTADIGGQFGHLENKKRNNALDVDSTTGDVGVGGRRLWMLFDEAARNRTLETSWDSTADTSKTRVALSTFWGPGKFRDIVYSNCPAFPIGYWDHPDKGRGRMLRKDDSAGSKTGRPGSTYWWTPWFEADCCNPLKPRSRIDVAQNVLMDPDVASNVVFDIGVLLRHISRAQATPPTYIGDLVHKKPVGEARDVSLMRGRIEDINLYVSGRGRLKLWVPLTKDKTGRMRPPQNHAYGLFADPSQGQGAANTAIAIGDMDSGVKVGMLADPTLEPHQLARTLIMLAIWFGGTTRTPRIGWEINGPGLTVQKHLELLQWPALEPWVSTRDTKRAAAESLREAYAADRMIDYDLDTLREAKDYIILPGGRVEPQKLREDRDAEATHGDRVVATMGLYNLMAAHPFSARTVRTPEKGTMDWYIQEANRRNADEEEEEG